MMNALRKRLAETFPYQDQDVSNILLDSLATMIPEMQTYTMDSMAASFLASGITDPFDQRTRQAILNGGLDEEEDDA